VVSVVYSGPTLTHVHVKHGLKGVFKSVQETHLLASSFSVTRLSDCTHHKHSEHPLKDFMTPMKTLFQNSQIGNVTSEPYTSVM